MKYPVAIKSLSLKKYLKNKYSPKKTSYATTEGIDEMKETDIVTDSCQSTVQSPSSNESDHQPASTNNSTHQLAPLTISTDQSSSSNSFVNQSLFPNNSADQLASSKLTSYESALCSLANVSINSCHDGKEYVSDRKNLPLVRITSESSEDIVDSRKKHSHLFWNSLPFRKSSHRPSQSVKPRRLKFRSEWHENNSFLNTANSACASADTGSAPLHRSKSMPLTRTYKAPPTPESSRRQDTIFRRMSSFKKKAPAEDVEERLFRSEADIRSHLAAKARGRRGAVISLEINQTVSFVKSSTRDDMYCEFSFIPHTFAIEEDF